MGFFDIADRYAGLDAKNDPLAYGWFRRAMAAGAP